MKKISVLVTAILFTGLLCAQQPFNKDQQQVQQTIQKMFDALSNSDTISLKLYCTTDVKFYEYGQIWTIDTMILKVMLVSKSADYKRTNKLDFVNTTINRNIAWATYYLQSEITRNNKVELVKWMETVVLVKLKKQWKIKLLHSTLIKRT